MKKEESKKFTFYIPVRYIEELRRLAIEVDSDTSKLIRKAIRELLKKYEEKD